MDDAQLLILSLAATLGALGFSLYNWWIDSHTINILDSRINDYIIFNYTIGGYMDMISLSIPVFLKTRAVYDESFTIYLGEENLNKHIIYYIGYEVANSGTFFIYAKMKAKDGELKFSTFLGKNPCRFIVFTHEYLKFIPERKSITILEDGENVDYVFKPWFWQKLKKKAYLKIHVDNDNELVPYQHSLKDRLKHWLPFKPKENPDYEGVNLPSPHSPKK